MTVGSRRTLAMLTLALIAAMGVSVVSAALFPVNVELGTQSTTTVSTVEPALFLGTLGAHDVDCSLSTGTCSAIIANTGDSAAYDVVVESCSMTVVSGGNQTVTLYDSVNGTVGGNASIGISFGTRVAGTCSIPTDLLGRETAGSIASGLFQVVTVNQYLSYAAGTIAYVSFDGSWSS